MQNIRRQIDYQKPSNTVQMWCGDINKKHKQARLVLAVYASTQLF